MEIVTSFLMGGLSSVDVTSRLLDVESELREVMQAVKYNNRVTSSVESLLKEASR